MPIQTSDSLQSDSLSVYFPQTYIEYYGSNENLMTSFTLYVVLGALVSFLYVFFNKYSTYHLATVEVAPGNNARRPKHESFKYIWYSRFKSKMFKICFFYGSFAFVAFIIVMHIGQVFMHVPIPDNLAIFSTNALVDFLWAGLLFSIVIFPLMTSKLVGTLGFDRIEQIFGRPTDSSIEDDINNSRLDYIRHKVKQLNKTLNKQKKGDYNVDSFELHMLDWNINSDKIEHADLEGAIENAKDLYSDDVVKVINSVMKTIGDPLVESALNYRFW